MRCQGRLLTVGIALCAGTATAAHANMHAPANTMSLVLVRTTSGPSSFDLSLTAYAPPTGAFIGEIDAVVGRNGRVEQTQGGFVNGLDPRSDGVKVGSVQVRTCRAAACGGGTEGLVGAGISYASSRSRGDVNALFIILHGDKNSYELHASGWQIAPVPMDYRMVTTASAPVSASSGPFGVAVVTGATMRGGRFGSLAVATPPCSVSTTNAVSRGAGAITLVGGATRPTFTCPVDRVPISSYVNKPTVWSVDGWAGGDSTMAQTTLFVIDRPRVLPRAAP